MYAKQSHTLDSGKNTTSKYNNSYEDEESDQQDEEEDHQTKVVASNKQSRKQQEPKSELPEDDEEALYDEEEDDEETIPVDDTYDEIDRPPMSNEEKFEDDTTNDIHSSHGQDFDSTTPLKNSIHNNSTSIVLTPPLTQSDLLCTTCNKQFDNLHRLQRHMMCHDMNPELRKFKCDFCNKAFKFKHHLKVK